MNEHATLYFDGNCPLCRREMAHLTRLKSDDLVLQDIHDLPDSDALPDKASMLQSLHLRKDGGWVTGIDANIAAWQYTRIGFFWRWLSWPIVK
ncbi:MAG: DCC1-like thiol-disulfide oxidoreductase family protein, partial [Pseudomonadota bacterium]|nr:DCC1-like thiol-disulfide oxidoreductase family protein [Pseudomonadota bacterium]